MEIRLGRKTRVPCVDNVYLAFVGALEKLYRIFKYARREIKKQTDYPPKGNRYFCPKMKVLRLQTKTKTTKISSVANLHPRGATMKYN